MARALSKMKGVTRVVREVTEIHLNDTNTLLGTKMGEVRIPAPATGYRSVTARDIYASSSGWGETIRSYISAPKDKPMVCVEYVDREGNNNLYCHSNEAMVTDQVEHDTKVEKTRRRT